MSVTISRLPGGEAYDLIYPQCLATLSSIDQETMARAMRNSSQLWLGCDGDKVLACWGLIPPTLMSDRAYLWLYTTTHLVGHTFVLVRHSQRMVREMLTDYSLIVGHAKTGADKSIRWLKWLGAEFEEPQGPVTPFKIRAETWQRP